MGTHMPCGITRHYLPPSSGDTGSMHSASDGQFCITVVLCQCYLDVTLDQTLSHREHLSRSAEKLKSRNNLIAKLAGTSGTWRTPPLALCYSVAEYCCLVWARSSYTNLIDTHLHSSMRLISGCLQLMQLSWLPMLSNDAPPSLCCKVATDDMLQIIKAHPNWPVYADVFEHPPPRLASRHPTWSDMTSVDTYAVETGLVVGFCSQPHYCYWQPGFDLPRHTWSLMNRFQTGQGPCCANLHKWGFTQSPSCDYGQQQTMNESTPQSRWWRSHMAEICSTREITNNATQKFWRGDRWVVRSWPRCYCWHRRPATSSMDRQLWELGNAWKHLSSVLKLLWTHNNNV